MLLSLLTFGWRIPAELRKRHNGDPPVYLDHDYDNFALVGGNTLALNIRDEQHGRRLLAIACNAGDCDGSCDYHGRSCDNGCHSCPGCPAGMWGTVERCNRKDSGCNAYRHTCQSCEVPGCAAGQYLEGCAAEGGIQPGICRNCEAGKYKLQGAPPTAPCTDCLDECGTQGWLEGCGGSSNGSCVPYPPPPPPTAPPPCECQLGAEFASACNTSSCPFGSSCICHPCQPCDAGFFRDNCAAWYEGDCYACPAGKFKSSTGFFTSKCKSCEACPTMAVGLSHVQAVRIGCGDNKAGECVPLRVSKPSCGAFSSTECETWYEGRPATIEVTLSPPDSETLESTAYCGNLTVVLERRGHGGMYAPVGTVAVFSQAEWRTSYVVPAQASAQTEAGIPLVHRLRVSLESGNSTPWESGSAFSDDFWIRSFGDWVARRYVEASLLPAADAQAIFRTLCSTDQRLLTTNRSRLLVDQSCRCVDFHANGVDCEHGRSAQMVLPPVRKTATPKDSTTVAGVRLLVIR